jgi:hypothetical protein
MSHFGELEGEERTAAEVHCTLCALVTTQAAASSAWSEYASMLFDAETQAFFAARLAQGDSGGDSGQPSKKKRKLRDDGSCCDEEADDGPVAVVCEHCGGVVPEVSIRVASLDGSSMNVRVAQRGLVHEVRRLVGQVRGTWSCACSDYDVSAIVAQSTHLGLLFTVARYRPGPDRAVRQWQGEPAA